MMLVIIVGLVVAFALAIVKGGTEQKTPQRRSPPIVLFDSRPTKREDDDAN